MYHNSILIILMFFKQSNGDYMDNSQSKYDTNCPEFPEVYNGTVVIRKSELLDYSVTAHVTCKIGFDLVGPPKILCIDGEWRDSIHPQCIARCKKPPFVSNGEVQIEGKGDENNMYGKGVVATYSCGDGFTLMPSDSIYRICEKGIWSGESGICKPIGCTKPENISNGLVDLNNNDVNYYESGYKVQYWCKPGYFNRGPNVQTCQNGVWQPKPGPKCVQPLDNSEPFSCASIQLVPQATISVISGFQTKESAVSGTILEIKCLPRYINIKRPCEAGRLTCRDGLWKGTLPKCVPAKECSSPPIVEYAIPFYIGSSSYEVEKLRRYPIDSKVSYQCKNGYELEGNDILTCSISGCWTPKELPRCRNMEQYYMDVNGGVPVLVSLATGAGVLLLLVVVCLVVMCRRRKSMSRTVAIQPPPIIPRPDLTDHATLLHHPDRLALIAFAEGIQNGQAMLPTYEEATRERQGGFTSRRFQRPQLSSLVGRRMRNCTHVEYEDVRPASMPFHGTSTRSGGDPMGSTDTMAVSENSTTVTLDTASSHSGSQPASCRAHCGSLASFDTNSVLNTEGVPLLEESELEEVNGSETMSLAMENRSMADNNSFKYSTSPEMG